MGVDTGGTFTDLVAIVDGVVRVRKVLSTPEDPARAVLAGLAALAAAAPPTAMTYSSTVATNALLEKKGARVALFTNAGFEDLIEIGRQNRTNLYALWPSRPEPLIPRAMRIGVDERTFFDGRVARPLRRAELVRLRRLALRCDAEAFAICLLHAYANPASERKLAATLDGIGPPLSVSHRLLNEYREHERLSTTVVNAYLAPRMSSHLDTLSHKLKGVRLRVMQSNGDAIGVEVASREPVRTLLSGPAAGVIGAAGIAQAIGIDRFITFDMGGTSTDVSLYDRRPHIRMLSYPSGYAVRTPMVDIHTVGAGGGSLARIDSGGSLRVGPESAGAEPGPACYGRGTAPTVTDADLVAGRLIADRFLGGAMKLYPDRSQRALAGLARTMKSGIIEAARGVIRVVNANMERALRVITVERGFDPREFALMAFGGAGPMHACELALDLSIGHIVMPLNPGLLCARGALGAPLGREYSLTIREAGGSYRGLVKRAQPLIGRATDELVDDGARRADIRCELWADVRYEGQSYEIETRLSPRFKADFHAAHQRLFGHSTPSAPVEVVNLRLRASATETVLEPPRVGQRAQKPVPVGHIQTLVGDRLRRVPVYQRQTLGEGSQFSGPAVVVEMSSTAYVSPEFSASVDRLGNLHLEVRP